MLPLVISSQGFLHSNFPLPESKKAQAAVQKAEPAKEKAAAPSKPQLVFDKKTATGNDYLEKPVSTMRKVIAERLLESKTKLPHYYLTAEVNMNNLMKYT